MCGIFGAITAKGLASAQIEAIKRDLERRGPDGQGSVKFELGPGQTLDLVHRRLAIIDLSRAAAQPMSYDNQNLWIVYNGEIFNYKELREELKAKGHRFVSSSDTEVVLASYKEWGGDCVKRFNGDWAFCLYDKLKNSLFLSRDRLGVKPLYYCQTNSSFAFCSEIKTLLNLPFVGDGYNLDIVSAFVLLGVCDFSQATMYKNILQLEPATNMIVNLGSGQVDLCRYWNPDFDDSQVEFRSSKAKKYASEIRGILEDAVRLRLRADVAVGTCLSGGIDSSAIVSLIHKLIQASCPDAQSAGLKQKTFTAAYKGEDVDEEQWAQIIIGSTGACGEFVYPQAQELQQDLDDLVGAHHELFNSTSIYAQYRVMQLAATQVKVVLDGQAADELFGGYLGYHEYFWRNIFNLKHTVRALKREIFPRLPPILKKMAFRAEYRPQAKLLEKVIDNRINIDFLTGILQEKVPRSLSRLLYLDETKYNLRQLLRYEDANSMRFSLEARVPFTDYRLVEYVLGLPVCYKIHQGWTKYILRKAIEDLLPQEIVWRRDKIGFQTPEKKWLSAIPEFNEFLKGLGVTDYQGEYFWWRLFNFIKLNERTL